MARDKGPIFDGAIKWQYLGMRMPRATESESLTLEEIKLVQDSFRVVEGSEPFVAENFFQQVFSYAPGLRKSFARDPWSSKSLFIDIIRGISVGLTHPDRFDRTVRHLAVLFRAHATRNDLHYYIGAAWFSVLSEVLGRGFTQKLYAAWFKVFEAVIIEVRCAADSISEETGTDHLHAGSSATVHASAA